MKITEDWMKSNCSQEQLQNSLSLFPSFHIKRNSVYVILQNKAVVDDTQIFIFKYNKFNFYINIAN